MPGCRLCLVLALGCCLYTLPSTATRSEETPAAARQTTSLDGVWKFWRDGAPAQTEAKSVTLPTHWETHEGLRFDGVGAYERTVGPITLKAGRRLLVHFDAVATHATVFFNDTKVGEHLGGWTPFRCDVTDQVRAAPPGSQHRLRVRVDEKVGHNTQGFLPIIQPHFGGVWQGIRLIEVPALRFDDLAAQAYGDWSARMLRVAVPLVDQAPPWPEFQGVETFAIAWRRAGSAKWTEESVDVFYLNRERTFAKLVRRAGHAPGQIREQDIVGELASGQFKLTWPMPHAERWSPDQPVRYEVRLTLPGHDAITLIAAFRDLEAQGEQLLLNGQPIVVRGVLNWGYYPPSLAPSPSPEQWRADLRLIRSWGFNLMKCCLWVPPRRLLEIADEEGMLLWMEYPTWHPKIDQNHRAELRREYAEFFHHDGNHPSVILRSLTCETGHQADLSVVKELYELGKRLIPGALIVDDSSWIEWIRVGDFYDDHPYGNNHTWLATVRRLQDYVKRSKLGVKPLVLGEAIAADTWVDTAALSRATAAARADARQAWTLDERGLPYWVPGFYQANQAWLKRMEQACGGPLDEARLRTDSLTYAMAMRRYQVQALRWAAPHCGYVVSVIRDFPLASMGLLDYQGAAKWSAADWRWNTAAPVPRDPWPGSQPPAAEPELPAEPRVQVVTALTPTILADVEAGGRVLLLPDGRAGSVPLRAHWFLRGGPMVNPHHPLVRATPGLHELLVAAQHFDLAGDVIPDVEYLEEIEPILMLWDNHDIKEVKTHGLVFETRVGRGRLLVSALRHDGEGNEVGRWLRRALERHLALGPPPRRALHPETIERLRAKLREKRLALVGQPWRFRPDGQDAGMKENWATQPLDESWVPIKIAQHWEGQGYPNLDGWAWYRLQLTIPADWPADALHLHCEGLDDYGEFFVDGKRLGSMGDQKNKRTAFNDRASLPITGVKPGQKIDLAVRVFDWYGAGGLHRPLTLSTEPLRPGPVVLR